MTDTSNTDDGCRSRRCRQVGRCNCLHVYEDGTAVPGSGTAANPYVHATPPLRCILDSNGVELSPDSAKCITLPSAATGIQLGDGTLLTANVNGIIRIPDSYLREFTIIDSESTRLAVTDGASLIFDIDGGPTQNYVAQDINYPTIQGTTIVFPGEKGAYFDNGNLFDAPLNATRFSQSAGAGGSVVVLPPQTFGTMQKDAHLRASIGIGLADLPGGGVTATANEVIEYEVFIIINSTPIATPVQQSVGHGFWSPNQLKGYTHDTYVVDIDMGASGLNLNIPSTISIRIDKQQESINAARRVYAECQVAVQWV